MWSFVAKSSDSAGTARGGKGKPAQGQKKGGKTASRAPAKAPARPSAAAIRYQQQEEQRLRRNNQLLALLLFVLGIFLVALSIFDGPKVWGSLHDLLRGISGPVSYGLGPLLIYIAVMTTLEKEHGEVHSRVWQLLALMVLLCGIAQLCFGLPRGDNFFQQVMNLWLDGVALKSGGLLAMLFGWPALELLGKTGAIIVHALLVFVLVMVVSGRTLLELFCGIRDRMQGLGDQYQRQRERRAQRQEERRQAVPQPAAMPAAGVECELDVPLERPARKKKAKDAAEETSPAEDFESALSRFRQEPAAAAPAAVPPGVDPETGEVKDPLEALIEVIPDDLLVEEKPEPTRPAFAYDMPLPSQSGEEPVEPLDEILSNPPSLREKEAAPSGKVGESAGLSDKSSSLDEDSPLEDLITKAIENFKQDPAMAPLPEDRPAAAAPLPDTAAPEGEKGAEAPLPPLPEIQLDPPEEDYHLPPVSLLKPPKAKAGGDVTEELKANAARLVDTLKSFGVQTRIVDICRGPAVTRYELQPSAGVKISKITNLADDIALNLATAGVRIEAPIPNKPAVGIEVPNRVVDTVSIRELIDSDEFRQAKGVLPAAFGRDIAGDITIGDIAAMPHMLIAGTTGSGKSVCVNAIIISLLYRFSPRELRMIMIDPKMVELVVYNGIPHLLVPLVTDPRKAAGALGWAVNEMLRRYSLFSEHGTRDIKSYNRLAETEDGLEPLPHTVIIIDELSDLMMAAPNEVEDAICRLAQMARAAGMYLIIATQRPSVDVVTGLIKANIPSRIALTVSSQVDSRTIIDTAGAEKLLGRGDMLYYPVGISKPLRVQGCFVSDEEVEAVARFIKDGQREEVTYDAAILEEIDRQAAADSGKKGGGGGSSGDSDPLVPDAVEALLEVGQGSTSFLQRRLKVGYARAARIMDELEDRGIVGPQDGAKPRELQITRAQWAEIKERML